MSMHTLSTPHAEAAGAFSQGLTAVAVDSTEHARLQNKYIESVLAHVTGAGRWLS